MFKISCDCLNQGLIFSWGQIIFMTLVYEMTFPYLIIGYGSLQEVNEPCVQMKLHVRNPDSGTTTPISFTVDMDKFRILLNGMLRSL